MRITFFHSEKPREKDLARAFCQGLVAHGVEGTIRRKLIGPESIDTKADVVCMVGVKSRDLWRAHRDQSIHCIYFDKGYVRHRGKSGVWEYWRVAVNNHHPTAYLAKAGHVPDRLDRLGLVVSPWRKEGSHILFAGSSRKYHDFYNLPDPTSYAESVFSEIRGYTDREIIYRPKPSWHGAIPIQGTRFSQYPEKLDVVLNPAHALVTHGSNACFEALLYGIPTVVLGNAIAAPISTSSLKKIEKPRLASDPERTQLLSNLAYCQWTMGEFRSGEAWETIRKQF